MFFTQSAILAYSIGGLGQGKSQACVTNVTVQDVFLQDTENGVRIKTWQVSDTNALNLSFQLKQSLCSGYRRARGNYRTPSFIQHRRAEVGCILEVIVLLVDLIPIFVCPSDLRRTTHKSIGDQVYLGCMRGTLMNIQQLNPPVASYKSAPKVTVHCWSA